MSERDPVTELQALLLGEASLKSPSDDGKMRQPDAQTKPWKALGISRATWYRRHKPESENELKNQHYWRQKRQARSHERSVRTVQRQAFIFRYGIPELHGLALHWCLPFATLEEIAKWEHGDQYRFFVRLLELVTPSPYEGGDTDLPVVPLLSNWDDNKRHSECWTIWVDKYELKRAAKRAFEMTLVEVMCEAAP